MQVRLSKELYDHFKEIAQSNLQVPSMLVRKWIEDYVEENKEETQ